MDFVQNFPLLLHYFIHVFRHGELGSPGKGRQVAEYGCYRSRGLYVRRAAGVPSWVKGTSYTYMMGHFPAPWGNEIRAGVLEAGMALFSVLSCSFP